MVCLEFQKLLVVRFHVERPLSPLSCLFQIAVIQKQCSRVVCKQSGIFFFRFGFFGQVCGGFLFFSFTQQQFCVEEYDFAVVGIRNTVAYGFGTFDVAVEHLLSRQENQRVDATGVDVQGVLDTRHSFVRVVLHEIILGDVSQFVCFQINRLTAL